MWEETIWHSDDGRTFETEEECYAHELSMNLLPYNDEIVLLDRDLKRLPLTLGNIEDCHVMKAFSAEAATALKKVMNEQQIESPWDNHDEEEPPKPGRWVYEDRWVDVAEKYAYYLRIMEAV